MGRPEMSKPGELYACVFAKEFPTQAMLRLRPELCHLPCVVMEGEPPLQYVCSRMPNSSISFLLRKRNDSENTNGQTIGNPPD